jgi:hypothetical protein
MVTNSEVTFNKFQICRSPGNNHKLAECLRFPPHLDQEIQIRTYQSRPIAWAPASKIETGYFYSADFTLHAMQVLRVRFVPKLW